MKWLNLPYLQRSQIFIYVEKYHINSTTVKEW